MEHLKLEIIEPSYVRSDDDVYFDGKYNLKIKENAAERIGLTKPDEYVIFAKLGEMTFLSKKKNGDGRFGFHARNRNAKKTTYYITTKDLLAKMKLTKGYYRLGEGFEQDGFMWFKLEKL